MYRHFIFSLVGCLSLCFVACEGDAITANNASTQPTVGKSFTIANYSTDTTHGNRVVGSEDTATYTVQETKLTLLMKSNATYFKPDQNSWFRFYINYEANGDVSVLSQFSCPSSAWATLPVASKTAVEQVLIDSTMSSSPVDYYHVRVTSTATYEGTESVGIGGNDVTCVRIKQVVANRIDTKDKSVSRTFISTYRYAPSLGFFTSIDCPPQVNVMDASPSFNTSSTLIRFK